MGRDRGGKVVLCRPVCEERKSHQKKGKTLHRFVEKK